MNRTLDPSSDPLLDIELRIAHRADELDERLGRDPAHILEHWRTAEEEVWFGESSAETGTDSR